jgi:hypothetical protein
MAFILEDGTGVAGANAYVDPAYVTAYLTDRGRETENTWSTRSEAEQKVACIKATDYIELMNSARFAGYKEFPDTPQGLSFPRILLADREGRPVTGIPEKIKQAAAEYSVRALAAELLPDPSLSSVGGEIIETEQVVGPIKNRVKYQPGTTSAVIIKPYPAADRLLAEFWRPSGGTYR